MGDGTAVPFGQKHDDYEFDLNDVASGLRTFTEELSSQDGLKIRSAMAEAELIVFLGFGYIEQNMALLKPTGTFKVKECLGTALFDSDDNREQIGAALKAMFHRESGPPRYVVIEDLTCRGLFDQHARRITG